MAEGSGFFDKVLQQDLGTVKSGLCVVCKGAHLLCGRSRCPLMIKFYAQQRTRPVIDLRDLAGSSPPAVFVGRYGYPKVDVGPLVPGEFGDTSIMDQPERWNGKSIDDIVDMRFRLVRGKQRIDAVNFRKSKLACDLQELALTEKPVAVEAYFRERPRGRLVLDDEVEPFGPSARLENMVKGNGRWERNLEKNYYDTDLRAADAVVAAYRNGTLISEIQKAFSVGTMGADKRRRFVPTRWSITAVDDIIGKDYLSRTKYYPTIDEFRVYHWEQLDNRWCILMLPTTWRYELIEAWYPETTWNPVGRDVEIMNDFELFGGRTDYAQIGGCYYAARMAVNELLEKEHRTAGAVVCREAHPGYVMPVGVWNVRENVRMALTQPPYKFDTIDGALGYIDSIMDLKRRTWIKHSGVLTDYFTQRRIEDYYGRHAAEIYDNERPGSVKH
ncbi:MAG: Nre family DNA repair protein [Candidatus Methanomethylophilus sp.]|nr:Nre family DNA repair protein [Methanomethylophilus sp.]MDD3232766.1 Nre family DNA repair protein [Methanomethylophilus sp.]MDD4221814.1 Nre family DNA repair protein [Methanomethylophilus sp.]MDD4668610.1 Nre family DNA repair protein [Methanomethylophilus sp.]